MYVTEDKFILEWCGGVNYDMSNTISETIL